MAEKIIDPQTNVEDKKLSETIDWGQQNLDNIGSLSAGGGTSSFKFDQASGLWLGAERFADAPFRVDMNGNVNMKSANIIVNDGSYDRVLIGYQEDGF